MFADLFRPDGNPPIPPDAKLTYELQLLAVRDGPNIANMTNEQRLTIGYVDEEIHWIFPDDNMYSFNTSKSFTVTSDLTCGK